MYEKRAIDKIFRRRDGDAGWAGRAEQSRFSPQPEAYGINNRNSVGGVCSLPGDATADATLWRNGVMIGSGKSWFKGSSRSRLPDS